MKKLISLALALLLCCALSLTAFADLWIPPTDDGGYCDALAMLAWRKDEVEVINRYASEYLQAGLEFFSDSTADEDVAAAVVRMICQHPERYEGISYACGRVAVIGIPEEVFAACAEEKFGRTLRADNFFDCENGIFHVKETAELWELSNRFAVAEVSYYNGESNYHFSFKIYETTADPETCYALEDPTAAENAEFIGYCYIDLRYSGYLTATHFEASDFTLTQLDVYAMSVSPVETEIAETRETQQQTPEETAAPSASESTEAHAQIEEPQKGDGFWTTETIVVTAVVAAAVIGAGIAVLLLWKKKR